MNKKGQLGIGTVQTFLLAILTLVVISFAVVIALGSLSDTQDPTTTITGNAITNETITLLYLLNL